MSHSRKNRTMKCLRRCLLALLAAGVLVAWNTAIAAAQQQSAPPFQAYALRHAAASDVEAVLLKTIPSLESGVEIVADVRQNRILVRGSIRAQQLAAQMIRSLDVPSAPQEAPRPIVRGHVQRCSQNVMVSFGA